MPRKRKKHYFDNKLVEELLTRYVEGACTDRALRDEIMTHALPLIEGAIRSHEMYRIYGGEESFRDLVHAAWIQIERALYKFEPGRARAFSMFTQIAVTSALAYVKKHTGDRRHEDKLKDRRLAESRVSPADRYDLAAAVHKIYELAGDNKWYWAIAEAIEYLLFKDDDPRTSYMTKIVARSGASSTRVRKFFHLIRDNIEAFDELRIKSL